MAKKSAQSKRSTPKSDPEGWKTTESALLKGAAPQLIEAYLKLRGLALELDIPRIYASGKAIMFSGQACYFFVRPKKTYFEVVVFLGHAKKRTSFQSVRAVSSKKWSHHFKLLDPDQVEGELTDALMESTGAVIK